MHVLLPYSAGLLVKECHESGHIVSEEFLPEGTALTVLAPPALRHRLERYEVQQASQQA